MSEEAEKWKKRYERERTARKESERLLEAKSLQLYEKNKQLEKLSNELSKTVERRTEELKYSVSKLREEEQRLSALAHSFPGVIYQWYERPNGECGFYYVSPRSEEFFGFSAKEALKNWRVVQIHHDDAERWKESIQKSVQQLSDWHFEGRLITSSGEEKWWRGTSRPAKGGGGEVIFNGVMLDITKIKKAEAEIRRLSLVASHTMNGVVITDESGRILWINEAFEHITGYTLDEMRGKKPGQVLQGPMTDTQTVHEIGEKLSRKEPLTAELLNYHKNGQTYWLRLDINPLFDDKGQLTNFIGIETDITRQKDTEIALKLTSQQAKEAAEDANRANQAKSRFLASMSHEIRTPLNGVLGYTQVLRMREDLPKEAFEMIGAIERSGEHLLNLINDILDLSKIEAGKFDLESEDLSLSDLLRDLEDMFRPTAELKSLDFQVQLWDYETDEPVDSLDYRFRSDGRALRQVLLNLVGNAIKFTKTGSVYLRAGHRESSMHFDIIDTGTGIPDNERALIFEAFEQSATTKHKAEGTGLGLPICRKLVELMHGEIDFESTHNKGTRFWFEIPYIPPIDTTPLKAPSLAPRVRKYAGPSKTILVVEDDDYSRCVLKELLIPAGFRVEVAENGEQGLAMAKSCEPDLVATDLLMPRMDGFELCYHLKNTDHTSHTPVIAISASVIQNGENAERLKNFDAFVSKPVKARELFEILESILHLELESQKEAEGEEHREIDLDSIELPSLKIIQDLHHLAADGDILTLQQQLEAVKNATPAHHAFYSKLEVLASEFRSDELEAVLSASMEQKELENQT